MVIHQTGPSFLWPLSLGRETPDSDIRTAALRPGDREVLRAGHWIQGPCARYQDATGAGRLHRLQVHLLLVDDVLIVEGSIVEGKPRLQGGMQGVRRLWTGFLGHDGSRSPCIMKFMCIWEELEIFTKNTERFPSATPCQEASRDWIRKTRGCRRGSDAAEKWGISAPRAGAGPVHFQGGSAWLLGQQIPGRYLPSK